MVKKSLKFKKNIIFHFLEKILKEITFTSVTIAAVLAVIAAALCENWKEENYKRILNENSKAMATIVAVDSKGDLTSLGSGFFVSRDGILVTSYHVIENIKQYKKDSVMAKLASGACYLYKNIIRTAQKYDLAILQFDGQNSPSVNLGNSDEIKIGDKVSIIGTISDLNNSISEGIINFVPRKSDENMELVKFTAAISGTSGGGLFNVKGQIIGITTVNIPPELQKKADVQNLRFAVPVNIVQKVINGEETPIFPENADYYYSRGILAENKQNYDEAIQYFQKVIELDDQYVDAYLELGSIYYEQGLYDGEIEFFSKATKLNPSNVDAVLLLAEAYENTGRYDLSIENYKKVLELRPKNKDAMYSLGILYIVQGKQDKASEIVPQLVNLDSGLGNEIKILIDRTK